MAGCGCSGDVKFDGLSNAYKRALWAVIAINATMFPVEMTAGVLSGSQALKADALDFLGDAATYGITLFVIGMPSIWRSRAALLKGASLGAMGVWVLGSTAYQLLVLGLPRAEVMGAIGFLALVAAPPAAPPRHQQRLLPTLPLPRQTAEITQFLGSLLASTAVRRVCRRQAPPRPSASLVPFG